MPLSPEEFTWLTEFAGASRRKAEFDTVREDKARRIQEISVLLEGAKNQLRESMTFTVRRDGVEIPSMTETSEQTEELDTRELTVNTVVKPEAVAKANQAFERILRLQEQMRSALTPSGERLFTDEEIAAELYTPLVREKVMPENFVPAQFSRTQEMLNATNQLFTERQAEYEEEHAEDDPQEALYEQGKKGIGTLARIGKKASKLFGGGEAVADMINLAEAVGGVGAAIIEAVSKADATATLADLSDNLGTILEAAVKVVNPDLTDALGGGYRAAVKLGTIVAELRKPEPEFENIMEHLAEAVVQGCRAAGSAESPGLNAVGQAISGGLKIGGKKDVILKAYRRRDFASVVKAMTEIAKVAVESGMKIYGGYREYNELQELNEQKKAKTEAQEGRIATAAAPLDEELNRNLGTLDAQLQRERQEIDRRMRGEGKPDQEIVAALESREREINALKTSARERTETLKRNSANEIRAAEAAEFEVLNGRIETKKAAVERATEELKGRIEAGVAGAAEGLKAGKEVVDAVRKGEIDGAAEAILGKVSKTIGLAAKALCSKTTGKKVGNWAQVGISTAQIAVFLRRDPADFPRMVSSLGTGLGTFITLMDPTPDRPTFRALGQAVALTFEKGAKIKQIKSAFDRKDFDKVAELINVSTTKALGRIVNIVDLYAPDEDEEGGEEETPTPVVEGTLATPVAEGEEHAEPEAEEDEEEEEEEEENEEIKALAEQFAELLKDPEVQARIEAQADQAQDNQAAEELRELEEEYQRHLEELQDPEDEASEAQAIEVLIRQMQKDQFIMNLAVKASTGGMELAAKFWPALGVASSATKIVVSLTAAAKRATLFNKWMTDRQAAASEGSPLTSSLTNLMNTAAQQCSAHRIQAAMQLAEAVGRGMTLTVVTAAAGKMVEAAAGLASEAIDVVKGFFDARRLDDAWRKTQLALKDPRNRKLGLLARQVNPTLAKYSIAWGALEKNDPIARRAMSACGLTEQSLASKDADVGKVVRYLETMLGDAGQGLQVKAKPDWLPDEFELTARSWLVTKNRAVVKGGLKKQPTGAIDSSLKKLEPALARLAGTPTAPDLDACAPLLAAAEAGLNGYQPVKASNNLPHEEMRDVVDSFLGLIKVKSEEIEEKRQELANE